MKFGNEINLNRFDYSVKRTDYNTVNFENSTNGRIAEELFEEYRFKLIYDTENAYKKLDEIYSETKFNDIGDFKNYVKNNMSKIMGAVLDKYQVTQKEDYIQYVCMDDKGKYYIFRINSMVDYDVILDTYTIDIPEFLETYNNALTQERVMLNLNKIMLALNDKDYKYAYNMLADNFKINNFKNLEAFKEYVKINFFDENEFEYKEFGNETGTYFTYKIIIKDASGQNEREVTKTFIMQLEEGTDFKLSFNVQ